MQFFKLNFLRLGKRKPVRNLKKAGGIDILLQQDLNTHEESKDNKDLEVLDHEPASFELRFH